MEPNRRRKIFPDDFFRGFGEDLESLREYMDKIFENTLKDPAFKDATKNPFVYGFSVRMSPDGIPRLQPFGNIPPKYSADKAKFDFEDREPLTDVIENDDQICITMELPGVEKEDIDLDIADNKLTINVDTEQRKYHKALELKSEVDPKTVCATYKNGVLDITIKRIKPKEKKGTKIKIE